MIPFLPEFMAARWSGVSPRATTTFGFTPASNRKRTLFSSPLLQAEYNMSIAEVEDDKEEETEEENILGEETWEERAWKMKKIENFFFFDLFINIQ